jgi:hypothetical protein
MTHRWGRAPTAQDKIKRGTQGKKEHIHCRDENIMHMTHRMGNAPRLHKIK